MRYTHAEKLEVIHLVETADQPVKRTLAELGIPRSSFYRWYERYRVAGAAGLADQSPGPRRFWNRIPEAVRAQGVELALERPDQSPRQLAWNFTDTEGYFISETSVYRILKGYDLITSPAFDLVKAGEKFENPPKRVNELWQTDFTQFKIGIILLPGRALRPVWGDLCLGPNQGQSVTFVKAKQRAGKWEAAEPKAAFEEVVRHKPGVRQLDNEFEALRCAHAEQACAAQAAPQQSASRCRFRRSCDAWTASSARGKRSSGRRFPLKTVQRHGPVSADRSMLFPSCLTAQG